MSDSNRDEVWTDPESLPEKAEAETREDRPAEAGPDEAGPGGLSFGASGEESGALPYQDLLSELLGSWTEDEGGEPGGLLQVEGEAQVPLSELMARLSADPWPAAEQAVAGAQADVPEMADEDDNAGDAARSLEALQSRLLEDGATPVRECAAQATGEAEQAGQDSAEPDAVEPIEPEAVDWDPEQPGFAAEAALNPAPAEASIEVREALSRQPAEELREPAMPQPGLAVDRLEALATAVPCEEGEAVETPCAEAPDVDAQGGGGGEPQWAAALFEELVRADDAENEPAAASEAPEHEEAAEPQATGELAIRIDGWEVLASLPAPLPPSFSEPMLFEPPLPADSTLDWPVPEGQPLAVAPPADDTESGEGEGDQDVEPDDTLRRLVGQMLAEMAAASIPQDRSSDTGPAGAKATERFLSFSLAGEVYAVALAGILETDRLPRLTRVPGLPAWAIGVSNLRGSILPVVDLRRLLSLEEAENPQEGRILVVRPAPGDAPSALVVDRLEGVALLAAADLHPAPLWLDNKILPYLEGIGSFKGRLVNVLDLGRLFAAAGVSGAEPAKASERSLE